MGLKNFPVIYIASVDRREDNDGDKLRKRAEFEGTLIRLGIQFKVVDGCYNGEYERSYVLPKFSNGHDNELFILDQAQAYNQDTILLLDEQRNAHEVLCDGSGDSRLLGKWVGRIDPGAPDAKSYTYDPHNKVYYYIRGTSNQQAA